MEKIIYIKDNKYPFTKDNEYEIYWESENTYCILFNEMIYTLPKDNFKTKQQIREDIINAIIK